MTLTNPFGIQRYLHPRRSGMIVFKGGGDPPPAQPAPIVDGGLSDEQYQNLVDNQNEGIGLIGRPSGSPVPTPPPDGMFPNPVLFNNLGGKFTNDLPTVGPGFGDYEDGALRPEYTVGPGFGIAQPRPSGATGLYGEFENLGDNVGAGFSGVNTGIAGVNTGVNTGFADLTTALDAFSANQDAGFNTVNTNMGTNAAAINTGLTGLQTGQDAGFTDVGNRFDTVDQANVNMQTAVDQGFQDQAQGFTDVNANMSAGFDANAAAVNTGFTDTTLAIDQGFGDVSGQLTDTQSSVLQGQQGLGSQLDTMSGTADAYATQSLQNQEALQSGQDGFVSSFDTYVDRYSDDTRLAQDTRTDMQTANANANQALRNDMAKTAYTEEVKANELARNVQALKIGQAKTAAAAAVNNPNLDKNMRQNFSNLTNSFDANGELIPTSTDRSGNRIVRSMDGQGNITLNSFNSLGQPIGSQNLNLARSLDVLSQVSNNSQSNAGGNASPFMQTR